jgi:hypothetical protein
MHAWPFQYINAIFLGHNLVRLQCCGAQIVAIQGSGQHLKITLSAPKVRIPERSQRPSRTFFGPRLSANLTQ